MYLLISPCELKPCIPNQTRPILPRWKSTQSCSRANAAALHETKVSPNRQLEVECGQQRRGEERKSAEERESADRHARHCSALMSSIHPWVIYYWDRERLRLYGSSSQGPPYSDTKGRTPNWICSVQFAHYLTVAIVLVFNFIDFV